MFVFIWGDYGKNPQPALRPVFTAAQYSTFAYVIKPYNLAPTEGR